MTHLNDDARAEALAPASGESWPVLVTIEHPALSEPIRVTDASSNVTSRGNVYLSFPFELTLPGADPDQPGRTAITIHDPAGQIAYQVRGLRPRPTMTIEVVTWRHPDLVERGPYALVLQSRDSSDGKIVGEFGFEDALDVLMGRTITPATVPGIFA